ncbi:hypothetical protein DEFDS_0870 [Deferribacter desulfuricans SSM1]|uniref:Uncharacterized protein n=1 Tax=Deferribacter desulfuricans (strain DSM 14783 / JCM 11476 / NBRC 101012 / SSM1) TaxID=639282 RepID=D3PCM3_DEFDS|nr:hypothetical protein [Deferribacter desulfuricans]BAI80346.1 hypothetical protein DEFDS_0870 [Deferribacter desulfuricans SSM1]
MPAKRDDRFDDIMKLKKSKITIVLKEEYIREIRNKVSRYRLQKLFSKDFAARVARGEEFNITMKIFYRLCKLMGWKFPDYFKVIIEEPDDITNKHKKGSVTSDIENNSNTTAD